MFILTMKKSIKTIDLANDYNQKLDNPYPAITLDKFKQIEQEEKEDVEQSKYLATPMNFDNPIAIEY